MRLARAPEELLDALPIGGAGLDAVAVERARLEGDERVIDYRFGTAEAEEVALLAGVKPMVRQFLRAAEIERAHERFAAHGLHVAEARSTFVDPPFPGRVIYAGRDAARVRAAVEADAQSGAERALGRLLGYPRCCVDRYLATPPPRRNVDLMRAALASTATAMGRRAAPRLNVCDLQVFHYLSWMPCSFACAPSLAYAGQVAWQIAFRHGQALERPGAAQAMCPPGCGHQRFVVRIDQALGAHRLVLFEEVQVSIAGRFVPSSGRRGDGVLRIERAWPTSRDRHPGSPTDAGDGSAREAVARVCAALVAASSLEVRGDTLLVEGRVLLRSADLVLVPFGAAE